MIGPMHHHAWLSAIFVMCVVMTIPCAGWRYRKCQDGCCIHEYCAYGLICYPRIHCHFGCPDGYCTGTGNDEKSSRQEFTKPVMKSRKPPSGFWAAITENYSHSDKLDSGQTDGKRGQEGTVVHDVRFGQSSGISRDEKPDGICMPLPPCKKSDPCGMGHSCSMNFNLGYNVCQYNLAIGTTLCYDTHGHFVTEPRH